MDLSKHHIRAFILYNFKRGLKAAPSDRSINSTIGEDTIPEPGEVGCVVRYCTANHDIRDQPWSGCPYGDDDERIRQLDNDYLQHTAPQPVENFVGMTIKLG